MVNTPQIYEIITSFFVNLHNIMKSSRVYIFIFIAAVVVVVLYGMAFALYGRTVVKLSGLIAYSAIGASLLALAAVWLWGRIRPKGNMILRTLGALCVTFALTLDIILAINYFGASEESVHREKVEIEGFYKQERQRTRRVRNRYVASGEKYYVHYMRVKLSDGRTKDIQITAIEHERFRRRPTTTLTMATGALGFPVILPTGKSEK